MITAALNSIVSAGVKATLGQDTFEDVRTTSTVDVLTMLILLVLIIGITLVIGKWLWNKVLCKHVTIVRPVDSVWTLVLVMFAINWFLPSSVCKC